MAVLDGLLAEVTNAKSIEDGCTAFFNTTLPGILAANGVSQAQIDAITASLAASDAPLAAALKANTPATPPGPVVPPMPPTPPAALKSKKP